uniref:MADF domain-containing protein n=1 Tax=Panagrellus redivivus TaxID=6233 RepID=A0A7E4URH9_PANRE
MSNWNDVNRMRLIECFRKRPELWCQSFPMSGGDLNRRREALNEIVDFMNQFELPNEQFTHDEIRTQFKNLKDMYRRKVKKIRQLQAAAQKVEEPCWYYFQHLKFLDLKMGDNASRSPTPLDAPSIKSEVPSVMEETMPVLEQQQQHQAGNAAAPTTTHVRISSLRRRGGPTSSTTTSRGNAGGEPVAKRQRATPASMPGANIVNITEGMSSPPPPPSSAPTTFGEEDHLGVFGQFVAQTLRNLSTTTPALAIQVKRQIHDLLCEAELNQLGYAIRNDEDDEQGHGLI